MLGVLAPAFVLSFPTRGRTVRGTSAFLMRGIVYVRARGPLRVKRVMWGRHRLMSMRDSRDGGHASFFDRGYDCSGTVSYTLAADSRRFPPQVSIERAALV